MNILEPTNEIELHYYFSDETHSLNAFTRNKCETEFLHIVKEVFETLELEIDIETIAFQEGGLKEKWKLLGENTNQVSVIATVLTLILTIYSLPDTELSNLQKEDLQLSIEEHKLKIKRLKDDEPQNNQNIDTDKIISYFNSNHKVLKHRSNFYKSLITSSKITKIETSRMYNGQVVGSTQTIEKHEFSKYFISDSDLPIEIVEEANIEIIGPLLKPDGNSQWKGIYKEKIISLYMKDKAFKKSVDSGEVIFKTGFTIICVLEIKSALNELGELKVKNHTVSTVLSTFEDDKKVETEQGKRYLAQKKKDLARPSLFD